MPQDGNKSAVYRSFVKCNDPKGVTECTTMRKSKTISSVNSPLENKKKGKKVDFVITPKQESFSSSFLHLKEVSEGAQNLSKVIDTYSNGMRFDHSSNQIAKDLLRGALNLQESLTVLGKLQEAFRKKPKEVTKSERNKVKSWIERSKSDRYVDYDYQRGFQKPKFSIDESSRDCYDELKTVTRDNLARQSILPPNNPEKSRFYEGKVLDSMVNIPSTSSTQSSTTNFISLNSSDTYFSSDSTIKKNSKGLNLIAKLMGLEEIPSQQGFISSPKRFEIEKFPSQTRPKIDMAKGKKPQLGVKDDTDEKKFREIVETMQYKGLLKGSNYNNSKKDETARYRGHSSESNYLNNNNSRKVLIEDGPPIVLMKPMNVSRAELDKTGSQKLVSKSRVKDVIRGAVDFDEVCSRLRDVTSLREQGFRERELYNKEIKENEVSKKGFREFREKKKRLERVSKVNEFKEKLGEMQTLKSKNASISRDKGKVKSLKENKTETEPISRRRSFSQQKSSNNSMVVSKNKSSLPQKSRDRIKNQKPEKALLVDYLIEEDVKLKHGETQIDKNCEVGCDNTSTSSSTAAQLLNNEESYAHVDLFQVQLENTKSEIIAKLDEESNLSENKWFENQTKEKKLFISNSIFLKHAEEFFDIKTNSQFISNSPEITDKRLLLDVAYELMLQKKLTTQALHPPFLTPPKSLKLSPPLNQLVDEICNEIEEFSKYHENGNEKLTAESLFSVLERDLLLANGTWESGWRHGYGYDDVDKVICGIENQVFDELIGGFFTGFSSLVS